MKPYAATILVLLVLYNDVLARPHHFNRANSAIEIARPPPEMSPDQATHIMEELVRTMVYMSVLNLQMEKLRSIVNGPEAGNIAGLGDGVSNSIDGLADEVRPVELLNSLQTADKRNPSLTFPFSGFMGRR